MIDDFRRTALYPCSCAYLIPILHSCATMDFVGLAPDYYRKEIVSMLRKLCASLKTCRRH